MTDEDDCSVEPAHPEMFDESREDLGPLNLRCHRFPEYVQTVKHFIDRFASLTPGRLGRLVLGVIAGVPPDAPACIGDGDHLESCLDVPAMREAVDSAAPEQLIPSCNTTMGMAFPPRRLVSFAIEWAKSVGDSYVDSICKTDWRDAIAGVTGQLGDHIRDNVVCLPDDVDFVEATCMSPCWLVETAGDAEPCEADASCPQAWCPAATAETLDRLEPCRDPSTRDICTPLKRDLGLEYGTFGRRRCLIRQARRDPFLEHCGDLIPPAVPLEAGWYVTPEDWWHECDALRFYRPPGSASRFLIDPATSTAILRCWR